LISRSAYSTNRACFSDEAEVTATKILWQQIFLVLLIVLAMIWSGTQWTAWRLGFQPQLGQPWLELFGIPVYLPPAFFWWWYHYDAYAPAIFVEGGVIAVSGGLAAIRARERDSTTTYGSERWASKHEVRAAGLMGPDGVVLGRFDSHYLRHRTSERL
jgi:type IV secretion system protein VirD4